MQFKHGQSGVPVTMISRADLGQFEGANRDSFEVFSFVGKPTIEQVWREFAAGLCGDEFREFFDKFRESSALASERNVPLDGPEFAGDTGCRHCQHGCSDERRRSGSDHDCLCPLWCCVGFAPKRETRLSTARRT